MSTQAEQIASVTSRQKIVAVAVAALSIVTAGSFTTLSGLLTAELSQALDWSTSTTALGVAVNMVLYGAAAPFALHAMERYGIRNVTVGALLLLIAGSMICIIGQPFLFNIAWGVIVGAGCGSLTMAYGAFVARLWFEKTGTATGFLTAAAVTGQFALLPIWAWLSDIYGWRTSLIGSSALAMVAILANLIFMSPRFSGVDAISRKYLDRNIRLSEMKRTVQLALGHRDFWIIAAHFAMCGATTNGLMWSNFTPAANDQGLSTASASTILLLIGLFNIPGTIVSGWFTDQVSNRRILSFTFMARALTLLSLPAILGSQLSWQLAAFGVAFGIFDVATVPPVIKLCNRVFGNRGPQVFSWVNVSHQLGAGVAALVGSGIKLTTGSFDPLWFVAAGTCVTAALLVYASQYKPIDGAGRPEPSAAL